MKLVVAIKETIRFMDETEEIVEAPGACPIGQLFVEEA